MRSPSQGFTFFGLMFVVTLVGLALTGASTVWQVQQQRYKEQQLLQIGKQYRDAIRSYYQASPGGHWEYPRKLSDLLLDPRYPTIKRHIRKLWRDPMTRNSNWGLVLDAQGGIAGIYSRAQGKPVTQPDLSFGEQVGRTTKAKSYADWKFMYSEGLPVEKSAASH